MASTKPELARYVKCVSGDRTPVMFKIERDRGKVVERTPPYRPEQMPIEQILSRLNVDYSRRYEWSEVVPFPESVFRDFPVSELIATVGRSDRVAARMAEP